MSKKIRLDAVCPHCESELIVTVSRNKESEELEAKATVDKAGLKVVEVKKDGDPAKDGDPPKSKSSIDEELGL